MDDILEEIKKEITRSSNGLLHEDEVAIEATPAHLAQDFDISSPLGFLLSKKIKKPPHEATQGLIAALNHLKPVFLEKIGFLSPGFVNIKLTTQALKEIQNKIFAEKDDYPKTSFSLIPSPVLLEYCSANPTGPLHFGHVRGVVLGDTLSRILRHLGVPVTREYYINDVGRQIERLGDSIKARFYQEVLGQSDYPFPEDGYKGSYVKDLGLAIDKDLGCQWTNQDFAVYGQEKILNTIKNDLTLLNIEFDSWMNESYLHKSNRVLDLIHEFKAKGLTEQKEGALWFQSSEFAANDKERVLQKSNGATTYFASDLAYHKEKFERGFKTLVDIWGADHHGYVPRVRAGVAALGFETTSLRVILVQMVRLKKEGRFVALSKREGEIVTLAQVLNEVGPDAIRFFLNSRTPTSQLDFDLDLAKRQAPENPVYLIQYAHARISSIKKEKEIRKISWNEKSNPLPEMDLKTREILVRLGLLSETLKNAAQELAPHGLANYLVELARLFHGYYETHPVLSEKDSTKALARFELCCAVQTVLKVGLKLLGISAPEKM